MKSEVDFAGLWEVVEKQYRGSLMGIHGPGHWRQVERNGVMLAEKNGLPAEEIVVVRLFAVLHDSQRVNDSWDREHGQRAAAYARSLQAVQFELPERLLKKLEKACERHALGETTEDVLIGSCWDADRLDLVRLGVVPQEELMNTAEGKRIAREMNR